MKIKKIFYCIFLIFSILNFACEINDSSDETFNFGIYQVGDKYLTWENFQKIQNKDSLTISEWITFDMIKSYDFSSHILTLNENADHFLNDHRTGIFAVIANGKKCYYGSMNQLSGAGRLPVTWNIYNPGNDLIWLLSPSNFYFKDERDDEAVKSLFKSSGKYQGGLNVRLDDLKAISNSENPVFEFTFTITNLDNYSFYIVNPTDYIINYLAFGGTFGQTTLYIYDKNGSSFDYLNYRLEPGTYSEYEHHLIKAETLTSDKLLYLKKGESKTLSYKSTIFPTIRKLPEGSYYARLCFVNLLGASSSQRTISGGRVLNGYVNSNILDITYSKEKGIVINNKDVVLE